MASLASAEPVAIEDKSAKQLKAYIEFKGLTHSDCYEKSELRQRARDASDTAAVEKLLADRSLIADDGHWIVRELRGVLEEPCGCLPCGDSKNAFHLRQRLEGFRSCYPGVALDSWVDTVSGLDAYRAFAREATSSHQGREWAEIHADLRAIALSEEEDLTVGHLHCCAFSVSEAGAERCRQLLEDADSA